MATHDDQSSPEEKAHGAAQDEALYVVCIVYVKERERGDVLCDMCVSILFVSSPRLYGRVCL